MRRQTTAGRLGFIARDMARGDGRRGRPLRVSTALLGALLVSALAIAALRVDLIRVRYGLAEALTEEKALLEERRESLARVRSLRDPARLASLANRYGLSRPARIIDLSELPAVSAEPEGAE